MDQLSLKTTLEESVLPGSREKFRQFLQSRDENAGPEPGSEPPTAVLEWKFLCHVDKISSLEGNDLHFLAESLSQLKLDLTGPDKLDEVRRQLEDSTEPTILSEIINEIRLEIWDRVVKYHDDWVAKLIEERVVEDRSGETFFGGRLNH